MKITDIILIIIIIIIVVVFLLTTINVGKKDVFLFFLFFLLFCLFSSGLNEAKISKCLGIKKTKKQIEN